MRTRRGRRKVRARQREAVAFEAHVAQGLDARQRRNCNRRRREIGRAFAGRGSRRIARTCRSAGLPANCLSTRVSPCANRSLADTFFPDGATEIEPLTFGNADKRNWRLGGTLWIKDNSDPQNLLSRIWLGYDDLYNTFHKTDDLGGVCQKLQLTIITQRTGNFWNAGGHTWKPVDWVAIAEEF